MDESKLAMIQKILKLLELGKENNGGFSAEQEAANTMAAKMMAKHSIDFVDLRDGKSKSHVFTKHTIDGLDERVCQWESVLANTIAKTFDCTLVYVDCPFRLSFCGVTGDIEIAIFFYRHLRKTIGRKSELSFRTVSEQTTCAWGMVDTIGKRLASLFSKRESFMDENSRALVVTKNKGLSSFIEEMFPRVKKTKVKRQWASKEAYDKGVVVGNTINLNRPITDNTQPIAAIK